MSLAVKKKKKIVEDIPSPCFCHLYMFTLSLCSYILETTINKYVTDCKYFSSIKNIIQHIFTRYKSLEHEVLSKYTYIIFLFLFLITHFQKAQCSKRKKKNIEQYNCIIVDRVLFHTCKCDLTI